MKNLFLCIATIILISGQACSSKSDKLEKYNVAGSTNPNAKSTPPVIAADQAVAPDRKITKEATISFETGDYKKTSSAIKDLITKYLGQINTESVNIKENKDLEANFAIRIPAKSFDLFLSDLESVEGKIVNKDIKIQDITAEYIDVEARLKSKKELEARYIQLLAKATKISEMLEIEKQLNDQRTEIESIEGRFKFMQHEVANNLLLINILETKKATSGFFGKAFNAISTGWSFIVQLLIVLLTIWPIILIGCLIWFFISRYHHHNEVKRKILFEHSLNESKETK